MFKRLLKMLVRLFGIYTNMNSTNADLDSVISQLMKKHRVNTVGYAVIDNFEIVGVNTIRGEFNIDPNSIFQACSLSKTLTAYAVLDLAAKNIISLDAPINTQLKSWQINDSSCADFVTVRNCLTMTSGLSFGDPGTSFAGYSHNAKLPTLSNILDGVSPATNPPVKMIFKPGTSYYYSGAAYMVLQQLIEDVVGQTFASYMNAEILPKLGMRSSTFECPLSEQKRHIAIPGYRDNGTQIEAGWDHIVGAASGGLWSCPSDLAHFILKISNEYAGKLDAVVGRALIVEMLSNYQNTDFGLGVVVDGVDDSLNFRKNGHNTGYHNELIMFPAIGKGAVLMTNSALGMELINEFLAYVSKKFNWPLYKTEFSEVVSTPTMKRFK